VAFGRADDGESETNTTDMKMAVDAPWWPHQPAASHRQAFVHIGGVWRSRRLDLSVGVLDIW